MSANPEDALWGYVILGEGGKEILAQDATIDDLRVALKDAIDALEDIDERLSDTASAVKRWRSGK